LRERIARNRLVSFASTRIDPQFHAITRRFFGDRSASCCSRFLSARSSYRILLELKMNWNRPFAYIVFLLTVLAMPTLSSAESQLAVRTTRMPLAPQNRPYSFQLVAAGGKSPYAWNISGLEGSGLSFASSEWFDFWEVQRRFGPHTS
jgi:hypothetical protein